MPLSSLLSGKTSKIQVLQIAKTLFEALAPRLIEHGVTSSEVEGILRAVLVHEAASIFRHRGRRPNASQVSIKTGVDRHVVSGLLKSPFALTGGHGIRRDATGRVLNGWLKDPDYLKGKRARALPIGDPQARGRTAWSLIQRYAPGVWPRLVIDELIRLNYVTVLPNGLLKCKTSAVRASTSKHVRVQPAAPQLYELSESVVDFLLHERPGTWRSVQSVQIEASRVPLVKKMIRDRLSSAFAELADELGSNRWRPRNGESTRNPTIGITAFAVEREAGGTARYMGALGKLGGGLQSQGPGDRRSRIGPRS